MGFLLKGKQNEFNWDDNLWWRVMKLASDQGWFPEGTESSNGSGDWSGSYVLREGQIVTAEDARELGVALEKALESLPDLSAQLPQKPDESNIDEYQKYLEMPVAIFFSGEENKANLVRFIEFCGQGGFQIF